jgi:hypothetical protein
MHAVVSISASGTCGNPHSAFGHFAPLFKPGSTDKHTCKTNGTIYKMHTVNSDSVSEDREVDSPHKYKLQHNQACMEQFERKELWRGRGAMGAQQVVPGRRVGCVQDADGRTRGKRPRKRVQASYERYQM